MRSSVLNDRSTLITRALRTDQEKSLREAIERLQKKVYAGDLSLSEFEKRKTELEAGIADCERGATLSCGLTAKDTVLAVGPKVDNWENGIWATRIGLFLLLPFLVIYVIYGAAMLQAASLLMLWDTYYLYYFCRAVIVIANWLVSAFFFGYFFTDIRGNSGLEKGIRLSLAILLCLLPVSLVSASNSAELTAQILRAVQVFLFSTFLGLCAFDYTTVRRTLGERFAWANLARLAGVSGVITFGTVVLATLGVVVSSVLTALSQKHRNLRRLGKASRAQTFRRRQVSGPAGPGEDRRGKPPARWTVCLRPNGSSDCPESSEE